MAPVSDEGVSLTPGWVGWAKTNSVGNARMSVDDLEHCG